MQSAAAVRSLRLLSPARACIFPLSRASTTPFKTADPAVHSEAPGGDDDAEHQPPHDQLHQNPMTNDPTEPVKSPPFASSPKLENTPAGSKAEPVFQQKRRWSTTPAASLDEMACVCVGVDGTTPLAPSKTNWDSDVEEQESENREYYQHHKPSPLSNVEFADTRKPVSRATDGEKRDDLWGGEGRGYVIRETVDDALQRAEALFNAAKVRGDPSMPHSRALMRKLLERQQQSQQL